MTNKELMYKIFPLPKEAELTEGTLCLKTCRVETVADAVTAPSAAKLITEKLTALGVTLSDKAQTVITLTMGKAPAQVTFPEQGYTVEITGQGVTLTGFGTEGLHYAAVTLVQLLTEAQLPCCRVLDWPDMAVRGHQVECRLGSDVMEKEDWFAVVDDLAMQKINRLNPNIYGCWVGQYDNRVSEYLYVPIEGHPELQCPFPVKYYDAAAGKWVDETRLNPMFEKDFFGELVAYGKTKGIQVYPGFNSYGHNTLIPRTNPNVSAKEESGEPALTGYCTANPETYELLFDIYDQIIDRYLAPSGVDSFYVMLDEVWPEIGHNASDMFRKRSPWCKCPVCREKTEGQLFVEHAVKIISYLKNRGMKNVVMDCDMLIDHGPNGVGDLTDDLVGAIKNAGLQDVVIIGWWTYADLWEKLMFHSTRPELGLRRIVLPWNGYYCWCMQCNPLRDIQMLAKMGREEGCEGIHSYSSWDLCQDRNNHAVAEYGWSYDQIGSIAQVSDHYVKQKFPTKFEEARRAFQLFDYITEERIDQPEGNSSCLANYFMLRDRLSYYFYSYVEEGKPYPRVFPGEAVEKVCARKEDHIRAMLQISGMAKEAEAIWSDIAEEPACNRDMAKRYAYEAHNYQVLVDDYLAMLRMMELAESGEYAAVKAMAQARRDERLALMNHLQQVKELYLQPSQLRNHSIFMQFFADLADYIEKTPESEIRLDFFDMRYLESDRYRWLR